MTDLAAELAAATAAMVARFPVDLRTPATEPDPTLWKALVDAGFTALDVPEAAGGQGADLADALAVLDTLTEAGAVTPYVEHALLAAWVAGRVDHSLDGLSATVAVVDRLFDTASGTFGVRLEIDNPKSIVPSGARCPILFGAG